MRRDCIFVILRTYTAQGAEPCNTDIQYLLLLSRHITAITERLTEKSQKFAM